MHVAGKPDAADLRPSRRMRLRQLVESLRAWRPTSRTGSARTSPGAGGPVRPLSRVRFAERLAGPVDEQRLDAGRADINAEIGHEARTSRPRTQNMPEVLPGGYYGLVRMVPSAWGDCRADRGRFQWGRFALRHACPSARPTAPRRARAAISPSGFWSITTSMAPPARPSRVAWVSLVRHDAQLAGPPVWLERADQAGIAGAEVCRCRLSGCSSMLQHGRFGARIVVIALERADDFVVRELRP